MVQKLLSKLTECLPYVEAAFGIRGCQEGQRIGLSLDNHNEKEGNSNMKKQTVILLFLILGILTAVSVVMAGVTPGTGILETSHDLSSATGIGTRYDAGVMADPVLDRVCIYCHAPHHTITTDEAAEMDIDYYPLWNHDITTFEAWTPYENTDPADPVIPDNVQHQLNAELGDPGGVSKLCLSCHDGSVAISSYGHFENKVSSSQHDGTVFATSNGRILIGALGNLQNHHPIGFDYDKVAESDDEIRDVTSTLLGNNPYGLSIEDLLWQRSMECTSCHDVHNTKNTGLKFLWVEDTNSNLCFSCHKK
jgi:predicted CXXCH cytochrome family protein